MKKLTMIAAVLAFAGVATADDKKPEAKKPEAKPEAKKPEAKPEAKKEEPKKDAPKMELPKPAPELVELAKTMVGSFKCAGKAMDMSGAAMEFKNVSIKQSLDLEKFWIKGEMTGQIGPMKVHTVDYMTYDAGQKKYYRLAVDNHGGQEVDVSSDGKAWDGEMRMMGTTMKTKATMEASAKEWKVAVQMSMDGKKWAPGFEMTCKK